MELRAARNKNGCYQRADGWSRAPKETASGSTGLKHDYISFCDELLFG